MGGQWIRQWTLTLPLTGNTKRKFVKAKCLKNVRKQQKKAEKTRMPDTLRQGGI